MAIQQAEKRFYRSPDAYIGGVCAGIAEYFNLDALVVRILAIMLLVTTAGLAIIPYLVMWIHVPVQPKAFTPYEIQPESAELDAHEAVEYYLNPSSEDEDDWISKPIRGLPFLARLGLIAGLIVLFLALSFGSALLVENAQWWQFWPLLLFIVGIFLIAVPIRSERKMAWHCAGLMLCVVCISLLPMSIDIVNWQTLEYSFQLLWPIFILSLLLFVAGIARKSDALIIGGSFCFVIFWVLGSILCMIPGQFDELVFMLFDNLVVKIPLSWIPVFS